MIPYLILVSLLVPANLWASVTPHLHNDLSMRMLHGISTLVLMPPLLSLWRQRQRVQPLAALMLASFSAVLIVVNTHIAAVGMGVRFGWIDHLLLAIACLAVLVFYLLSEPLSEGETPIS